MEDSLFVYGQADSIRLEAAEDSKILQDEFLNHQNYKNEKAASVIELLEALPADNILEQNRKNVLLIFTQTIAQEIYQLNDLQVAIISDIAHQCPGEGGSSVYTARSIYQWIEEKVFNDEDLCVAGERSKGANPIFNMDFSISPNPANELLTIIFSKSMEDEAQISLWNISGQKMLENTIQFAQPTVQVPLRAVPEGMYFLQLRTSNGQIVTHKLMVER